MRTIAERIGISVDWDVATRTAIITTDDDFRAELESPEEAVLLHIEEEDGVESLTLKYVDRLKNGSLDWSLDLGMVDDGDDVQVKRSGQLVSVGLF
ncbi:hypothetical protein R50345_15415 [Paenibacillus sp. FSL R5-0345]|uniref:hypothetical protein n=1 Tax=Paenibacillus sp. FSL R5-0345 TaxID=1536770 RepID=UPI0004F861A0|nr:hypothetical protein [Paenibacillus sp. FSL R5-0345]AIQ35893.1 hypothetical protein R50345_15415 [Paenibacillus sp. FSL R5-0345]